MSSPPISQCPRRLEELEAHAHGDGALLQPHDANPVAMNPTAAALWELCDGQTTVDEMVIAVCRLFSVNEAQAITDVQSALVEMQTRGLIS